MVGTDFSFLRLEERPISEPKDSVFLQSIIPTMHGSSVDKPWRGIVTDDGWKYICFESQEWLLFNLVNDPLELTNLVHDSDYRDIRVKLNQRLVQWIQETDDCFFVPKVV
jgi:arylsulfatase A-like enzyme